ncbi:group II intron maturase-specific domain-containing protein [Caballeronia sp. LZ028]|uniref:group II intron maturase-specific domain-containing protein n=1 Tax=Caballeronia sp. LZ028 TaxID=3038563 RepID=UPI002864F4C4|nr:group II intron maturase-specific domain-containing protein [Caballeronia sp. LZ028]MDR5769715.1 group II intron maturase-specific domain-containing protein [Caballeronia sp. LZ028]
MNDGFVVLGHRIIRKRGARGRMRPVRTIPWEKYRGFAGRLVKQLSGNYSMNRMDLMEILNRQLAGWAGFYQYTDFTATMFSKLDRAVFWEFGYWLARSHRRGFRSLMREYIRAPERDRQRHGCCRAKTVEGGTKRWRFGVLLPAARVASPDAPRRKIRTSCAMRHEAPLRRAMPMLPLL